MTTRFTLFSPWRLSLTCIALLFVVMPSRAQGPLNFSSGLNHQYQGEYTNLIRFSLYSPYVDKSAARFMDRHHVTTDVFGGLEAFHLEQFVGEQGILILNARAIPANDEYRVQFKLDEPDKGFMRGGVDNFKVRYDGAGGYFHPLDLQFTPDNQELSMDRGQTWLEAGLRIPDIPEVTVRYARTYRDGQKPSLSWGDTRDIGEFGARNIVPSFWDSDEVRHSFDADAAYTIGKTDVSAAVFYETGDIRNTLNILRRPFESAERYLTDNIEADTDALRIRAGTVTRLRESAILRTHFFRDDLESLWSGDRIYGFEFGAMFDQEFPNAQNHDHGFLGLGGMTSKTVYSGGANLLLQKNDFTVIPEFRIDRLDADGDIDVTDTNVHRDGTTELTPLNNTSDRSATDLVGSLEVRYTGINNVTLYAQADVADRSGNVEERELETESGSAEFERQSDDSKLSQRYLIGSNWHPTRQIRLSLQAYTRSRTVDYDHVLNADGPLTYPGFIQKQEFQTNDLNAQIRWRPTSAITLSGRFDIQQTTIDDSSQELGTYESGDITSRVITGSLTASPTQQMFIRAYVSATRSRFKTPINDLDGEVGRIVLESKNDYINANAMVGAAVHDRLNVDGSVFYLSADNFVDNSDAGLPYDVTADEFGFALGGSYEIKPGLNGSLRFYHFLNREDTFGGTQDYDANLIYLSLTSRF